MPILMIGTDEQKTSHFTLLTKLLSLNQRERRQWAIYCVSPSIFIITFSYLLT